MIKNITLMSYKAVRETSGVATLYRHRQSLQHICRLQLFSGHNSHPNIRRPNWVIRFISASPCTVLVFRRRLVLSGSREACRNASLSCWLPLVLQLPQKRWMFGPDETYYIFYILYCTFFSMHLYLFFFLAKSLYVVFGCTLSTNKMILYCQSVGDGDVPSKTLAVRPRDQSNAVRSPSINVSQADGLLCGQNLGLDQRSSNDINQLVVSLISFRTLATWQTVSPPHINCSST